MYGSVLCEGGSFFHRQLEVLEVVLRGASGMDINAEVQHYRPADYEKLGREVRKSY